ncbi:hypothetical protein H206_06953 [Candidatus Electrothrix aarhusensis]|uniref:Uncharacterized protein n=1 Tax=Candidatus Electrothrix aarhusensis TaxID=1859131 RepID=A0A3S3UAZ7_9BACT|nr:hypothetical protein H206_06953 [Candidatus Electrothrix aarhusensis]
MTGGLVFSYDYDKTNNERNNTEDGTPEDSASEDEQFLEHFSVAPLFIIETTSYLDSLTLSFNPSFVYDQVSDQHDIDYNVKMSAYRLFTRKFRVELSNSFIYSDDPELFEDEDLLDPNQHRRRYKVNNFSCNATYNYGLERFIATGYSYEILRNEETGMGGYEDYDRHKPTLTLQHRFNPSWSMNIMWGYTKELLDPIAPAVTEEIEGESKNANFVSVDDDFNISNDSTEYRFTLEHQFNPFWNMNVMWGYTRELFGPLAPAVIEDIGDESKDTDSISVDDTSDDVIVQTSSQDFDSQDRNSENYSQSEQLLNDFSRYQLSPKINHILSRRTTFWLSQDYILIDYDSFLLADSYLYDIALGAEHKYSRRLSFKLDGGPSCQQTDGFDPQWGYNTHLGFNYDLDRNFTLAASIIKGYDEESLSSDKTTSDRSQGFTAFWELEMSLVRKFDTDLTGTAFFSYRDESQEKPLDSIASMLDTSIDREALREESLLNRTIYEGGCSLGYKFLRWYSADLRYTYSKQESELLDERYDEHRIYLTFSIQKELLRW